MKTEDIIIGKEYNTKDGDTYKVIQVLEKNKQFFNYLVWFPETDNYQVVYGPMIGSVGITDRSKSRYYGVGYAKGTKKEPVRISSGDDSYKKWYAMIERCYKDGVGIRAYQDVWVCEEWHNYMNFRRWCISSCGLKNLSCFAIDKDLFGEGKKLYSPETCCFLPQEINSCINGLRRYKDDNISETSAKTIYLLSKLVEKYSDILSERVTDKLDGIISNYAEKYKKVTGRTLESDFKYYGIKKVDLTKVGITAFIKYGCNLVEFNNVAELKQFVEDVVNEHTFRQYSSLEKSE